MRGFRSRCPSGAWALLFAAAAFAGPGQDLSDLTARLADPDPAVARSAWDDLVVHPGDVPAALAEGFGGASLASRRARARLFARVAGAEDVPRAVQLLVLDADREVRATLVGFLARPDLASLALAARVAALEERARDDPDRGVRTAASKALGALDDEGAVAALVRLVAVLPPPERALAAESLPATPRSAAAVRALVARGFAPLPPGERTPDDVLAAVLPLHGRLLADQTGGGETARERAPLVLGLRHPAPAVQRAAGEAFRKLLSRLRELGEADRALSILAGLEEQGLDHRIVHFHRARLAFFPGADPERARAAARAIRTTGTVGAGFEERLWLFRSLYLEGMAELALGHSADAEPIFAEATGVVDGILAERMDLADESLRLRHVDALHQRALVEVARVVNALVRHVPGNDPDVLRRLRTAHVLSLEAQLQYARLRGEALSSWDSLLDSEISPFRLAFAGLALPALSTRRATEIQAELGRAFASVSPTEMPGFDPYGGLAPELSNPLLDLRRQSLLHEVQEARLDHVIDLLARQRLKVLRAETASPGVMAVEERAELQSLDMRRRLLERSLTQSDGGKELLELRVPSSLALWLARDLRADGRPAESRRYAGRMRDDLEANGISQWWYYLGHERLAQIEMAIGSSWTDESEPKRAEEELSKAVDRLEDIERRMADLDATDRQLEPIRAIRASALVSLAVNANVKMREPERALEYYEEAYAIRQDDFMRVLLACYRARSNRGEEARALLREVRPYPQVYYNMACTHALLGEAGRALEFLEKELSENHASEESRRRQREWARGDPDLASLREDPRFRQLVGLR